MIIYHHLLLKHEDDVDFLCLKTKLMNQFVEKKYNLLIININVAYDFCLIHGSYRYKVF